jgi:ATP-dependent exoDNAse (exonuclease V) alpha subunit
MTTMLQKILDAKKATAQAQEKEIIENANMQRSLLNVAPKSEENTKLAITQSQPEKHIEKDEKSREPKEAHRAVVAPKPILNFALLKKPATQEAVPSAEKLLHGSGFTKKVAEKAQNQSTKLAALLAKKPSADVNLKIAEAVIARKEAENTAEAIREISHGAIQATAVELPAAPSGIVLDESQERALHGLRQQKYGVLIGAAGTGKTTVTKQLVKLLELTTPIIDYNTAKVNVEEGKAKDMRPAIAFTAFTGRAVQQMKRALPKEYHPMCATTHATLGYMPEYEEIDKIDEKTGRMVLKKVLRFYPTFNAARKLPFSVVVVDEAGMEPVKLWNELIEATHDDCRFILIGDINQLPPVQGRSVLGFAMAKWPTYALEKIHRQAADNPIIANAHAILHGKRKEIKKINGAFDIIDLPGGSIETFEKVSKLVKFLHLKGQFNPLEDAIITPVNDGQLGQKTFNEELTRYFNPPVKIGDAWVKRPITINAGITTPIFMEGDKLMLLQNDRERGLTNGMTGVITEIVPNGAYEGKRIDHDPRQHEIPKSFDLSDLDSHVEALGAKDTKISEEDAKDENQRQASHITTVRFHNGQEDIEVKFTTAGDYRKLTHAYAFTCHKSQGGEYPTVIIVLHSATIKMLSREWLYTAVTRARNRVILCCNERGLVHALGTQRIKGANIKEKCDSYLKLIMEESKGADIDVPILREPGLVKIKEMTQSEENEEF